VSLAARVDCLVALFRQVQATRLDGVPVCNPRLQVAAVGFEPLPGSDGSLGVLLTPWFMNLLWLPDPVCAAAPALAVGQLRRRVVGPETFDFIGAHEPGFGAFESCSLFSPMFEFDSQASARATAEAVLSQLRPPAPPAPPPPEAVPARRRFLLGAA
jgi:[NiFe] hydrogenase assembly HybE family chaperone